MCCVGVLQRGNSGDGCELALTLWKYDLRKGDLFVLSWARVRRVRWRSVSPDILICGGDVLQYVCLETIDMVYIAHVCV